MGEVIEWEDPPDGGTKVGVHQALFDELRRHPGRWAVFRRKVANPGGFADKLRKGAYAGIEPGELEVRTVQAGDTATIYVRVGTNGTEGTG